MHLRMPVIRWSASSATRLAVFALLGGLAIPAQASAAPAAATGSVVRVDQVAYVPGEPKLATVVSSAAAPLAWTLRNGAGATVAQGSTVVKGPDAMSGDTTHVVDFSAYDTVGTGYVLSVAGSDSYSFDISSDPVRKLRSDSLAFFYHQRSGTPIEAQYVGSQYARPAGHLGVAPNQGDKDVPCRTSCGYTLDVTGGWYDAGDQGKYVVNGGIAAWELQSAYERAISLPGADAKALGDGTLAIPQHANGFPDVLDEARWEVEFLLKMQVPEGRTNAGMAHHKVTDDAWTELPTRPEKDAKPRVLAPVSTAATLNLAAVAAQSARLWKTFDPVFSAKALAAAEKAYSAAKAHPDVIASSSDGVGGGAYDDKTVSDEFYWAAAELYTTTGKDAYRTDLTASSLYKGASFAQRGIDWAATGGMGDITLALVKNGLPAADVAATRSAITRYADGLLSKMAAQAYPAPHGDTDVYWGSNGQVANNAMLLGLAYDFTDKDAYKTGVFTALDYLLGRNPMGQSYVAGYGEQASHNMHHRFWAHQLDAALPNPPAGALSGGPNSRLEDPVGKEKLTGCKPQKCYLDDIGAYALNEVAINWNSALAWTTAWAAEKAGTRSPEPATSPTTAGSSLTPTSPANATTTTAVPTDGTGGSASVPCRASLLVRNWAGGFIGTITVVNGSTARDPWTVGADLGGTVRLVTGWNASVKLSGTALTAEAPAWKRGLAPGEEISVGFVASGAIGGGPHPVTLNGLACTVAGG